MTLKNSKLLLDVSMCVESRNIDIIFTKCIECYFILCDMLSKLEMILTEIAIARTVPATVQFNTIQMIISEKNSLNSKILNSLRSKIPSFIMVENFACQIIV